ncbi:MAG: DUF1501 domain-containing protein [Gemmatales bacterium]|nr:DUF1501 domain-containing protein [Gemmatales bacterium]MCS7161355.1 DUF1501 domain-containing protein [Gemmatales bacterium]MDW8176558.1 DUF1501 domain-containing protein [Gemmatales bacterium]MDW8222570.1 DUF1501 domain-containing protein [Gemmatales bacterium]
MDSWEQEWLRWRTRRHFFRDCAVGLGKIALACLLGERFSSGHACATTANPMAPKPPHFPARARSVIYLFMAGGPSQLELFDYKPALLQYHGQPIPDSFLEGKRFAFMDTFTKEKPRLLASRRKFAQHGQSGAWVSELLPHIAQIVDDLAFIKTVQTEVFNHGPAKLFVNTGTAQFGRPSMGAWITYGLGSEANDLPGFVVLQSGPRGPRGGSALWSSGFLPTAYQGVPFRSSGEPVLNLSNPPGISHARQADTIELIRDLNAARLGIVGDPEIATRLAAYETAFRMQTSTPELVDISRESAETLRLYGVEPGQPSFAYNCLLARRLVERGVRFVQLYHTDWDHHGGPGADLGAALEKVCREVDRPVYALITDLKRRGLLESTLVIWGGEFGRTPMGENRETVGRNHHIDAFTVFLAGGGIKPGITFGATDEFGFGPVQNPVHVHDLQATILHLLGLDHKRLTFRFQGRDQRLTDIGGRVLHDLLA